MPFPQNFPRRNRVISGCPWRRDSQAGETSGALITEFLLWSKERSLAVPGSGNPLSQEFMILLNRARDCEGIDDMLEELRYGCKGRNLTIMPDRRVFL